METRDKSDITYCHFSFKRPKNIGGVGYFAVAFYKDEEGKKLLAQRTVERVLWQDHQFITAIQSYEYALSCISSWQGKLLELGYRKVILVTDNSTLAGWIENPKKNKAYEGYMRKAVEQYRVNQPKGIVMDVGLYKTLDYEKSYKFCKLEKIRDYDRVKSVDKTSKSKVLSIGNDIKTIIDLIEEDKSEPKVV